MDPPGECRSLVNIWHELAKRMGLAEHFPWATPEEVHDWRLAPSGTTWADVVAEGRLPKAPGGEKKYLETGFATPSGKVELFSSVLDDLGFDPLPYHREAPAPDAEYPMSMFIRPARRRILPHRPQAHPGTAPSGAGPDVLSQLGRRRNAGRVRRSVG